MYDNGMSSIFQTTHNGHEQWCMKWKQAGTWRYVYAYTRAELDMKHMRRVNEIGVDGIMKPRRRHHQTTRISNNNPSMLMVFNQYIEHAQLADRTYNQRVHQWNNGFKSIEHNPIKSVSRDTIERIILNPSLKQSTALHYYHLINAVFNYAMKHGIINHRPMFDKPRYDNMTAIKNDANIERYFNTYIGILEYARIHNPDMYPIIKLMTLGLRIGEILSITRESISNANMTLTINKTLINDGSIKSGTKGRADTYNTRTIPLPSSYYEMLMNHINNMKPDDGLTIIWRGDRIFSNEHCLFLHNNHVMKYSYFNRTWRAIQRDYFNEIWNHEMTDDDYLKPHTTRHICASLMAMDGIPLTMAQSILGHMSAHMTQYYTHISASMKRDTITQFINNINTDTMNNIVNIQHEYNHNNNQ